MTISNVSEIAFKGAVLRQQAFNSLIKSPEKEQHTTKSLATYEKNGTIKNSSLLGKQVDVIG